MVDMGENMFYLKKEGIKELYALSKLLFSKQYFLHEKSNNLTLFN